MSSRIYIPPSYSNRFAQNTDECAFPQTRKELAGMWVPALGPTGVTLRDVSGFGNHGTLTNMDPNANWAIDNNQFAPGYSLDFDNDLTSTQRHVVIAGDPGAVWDRATNQLSLCAWIAPDGLFDDGRVISKSDQANSDDYNLSAIDESGVSKLRFRIRTGGSLTSLTFDIETEGSGVFNGRWIHLCGVYDGANMHIYVDRVLEDSTSKTGTVDNGGAGTELFIGTTKGIDVTRHYNGKIGVVKIYNRAITENEVNLDYHTPLAPLILKGSVAIKAADIVFTGELHNPIFRVKPRGYGYLREAA